MEIQLIIPKGGRFNIPLRFFNPDKTPQDMRGLGTWKCQVRANASGPVLLDIDVTIGSTDLDQNLVTLSAASLDTLDLPTGLAQWDICDGTGYYWLLCQVCKIVQPISR